MAAMQVSLRANFARVFYRGFGSLQCAAAIKPRRAARALRLLLPTIAVLVVACGGGAGAGAGGGTTASSTTSSSPSAPLPTMTFTANPTSVGSNGTATLTWSSTNSTSCSASGAWSGNKTTANSESVGPLSKTSTFTLSCSGAGGTTSKSVTVTAAAVIGSTIVGVQLQDQSGTTNTNIPVTFGQAFKPGDVPAGAYLAARTSGTAPVDIPLQIDAKATHRDGSLRHAVITAWLPSLSAGQTQTIELLSTQSLPSTSTVALGDLLATNFDAVVSLNVGGTLYQASARQLLQANASQTWLSGPLVTEWVVSGPFTTSGGTPHPNLAVRFNIRAYAGMGSVRVDVVVENDWALGVSPQDFTYDATVTVAGAPAYSKTGLTHFSQARWRKVFWWGQQPQVLVQHDKVYLMATGALPNYNSNLVVPETTLAASATEWSSQVNTEPMGNGFVDTYMPDTGSRRDIGVLPQWSVRHLLSQDPRAKVSALGNGDLAGSWPIHYRDKNTNRPISIVDFPNVTLQDNSLPACGGVCTALVPGTTSKYYTPDTAHQPSLSYYPYLITGDQYYLEELQFWATYDLLWANASSRNFAAGVIQNTQVRGQAWDMRTLGQTAYITPDADPLKSYFQQIVLNNVNWYTGQYPNNASAPALKFLTNGYALRLDTTVNSSQMSPWEDDFFTIVMGYLVDMGFVEAQSMRDWKLGFVVGRFSNSPAFCTAYATRYQYYVTDSTGALVASWANLQALNLALPSTTNPSFPNYVNGTCPTDFQTYLNATDGYIAHARGALVTAVNASYPSSISLTGEISNIDSVQSSAGANYGNDPTWAFVPR